jgi:Cdc6-like AAA superfamily ATPase
VHVLRRALTFIWGPPGCGKTFVLGEIVRKAFEANKRTLISSTTNKAVDQVLYSICKALGSDHPALHNGQVLRLGDVADAKLSTEFGDYVIADRVIARLEDVLKRELQDLQRAIVSIDASYGTAP